MCVRLSLATLLLVSLPSASARAAIIEVMPGDNLHTAVAALAPGDELVLRGGTYEVTARLTISAVGTETEPIIIRSAEDEVAHIHRPNADQNIVDIDLAEYVELRGIEFSGGSAGIRISSARYLTIRDCEIHSTNSVALRANDSARTYEHLHIVQNHIHDTNHHGEGMYLGCNSDGCRIANSIIERNYIHHLDGPNVSQGDGIEIKEGSYGNIVRDNVIHDVNYPCILTYGTVGNGPPNVIERNVMWNCGAHAIQSAADAVIRNNIILGARYDGIAMQPHQAATPSNLFVVHNTVLNVSGAGISVRDATDALVIANNAIYSQNGAAIFVNVPSQPHTTLAGNVGMGGAGRLMGFTNGSIDDFVAGHFRGAPPIDVFPAVGGALVGAAHPDFVPDEDFNTTARGRTLDVGAYAFDPDGNPGWTLEPAFKEFPELVPDDDLGGSTGSDATDDGDGATAGDVTGPDGLDDMAEESDHGDDSVTGDQGETASGDDSTRGCSCRAMPGPSIGLVLLGLFGLRTRRNGSMKR